MVGALFTRKVQESSLWNTNFTAVNQITHVWEFAIFCLCWHRKNFVQILKSQKWFLFIAAIIFINWNEDTTL